jgi:hypothetical protein
MTETLGYDRTRKRSFASSNARIDRRTEQRVRDATEAGREAIEERLAALDREWDVDRVLFAMFPVVGSIALTLGTRRDRRFLHLLRFQMAVLLGHALTGWCPPVVLLRRLGVRTIQEIDAERSVLRERLHAPLAS